ncbi:netrin receptor unc-5-like [Branchiostoma floridae x Branchiostoma belcheri]
MRKCVWLLLLCPWLVHGQLGPTLTGSPKTPTTDSWKCPKCYAWDDATHYCKPCCVCIRYPLLPFCSACPGFISAVPVSTTTPGPTSTVYPCTCIAYAFKGRPSGIWILVTVGASLSLLITVVFIIWKFRKRPQLPSNQNGMTTSPPKQTPINPQRSCTTLDEVIYSHEETGTCNIYQSHEMPHLPTSPSARSADSPGHCTPASALSNTVSQMWGEESCVEGSDSVCSTGKSSVATSDCNSVAEALIGKHGGILMLPNAATSLLFSPHSISNQINITLEILHNPVVLPELREDETLVSPFVFCGPHGWTFHKPVLLTFPHCGMSDRDDFTLLVTETSSQQAPDWMEVSSATPGIEYFVRDSECLVYTSHFTGFSLKSKGPKQVRLLAFSSVSDHLYRLRVYCINDTKDVIDRIKKEEQEFGFKQTDRGVSMTFLKNKHDLHLRAHLETPGWKFLNSSELVISYESVRRKRDSNVLFKLQSEPEHKKSTAILSLSICAFQDGNSDSPTYSIAEELPVAPGQTEMRKLGPTSCDHKGACNCKTPSQVCMVHSADITDQAFLNSLGSHRSRHLTIPHKLRTQLCIKLDPPKYCGDDWRSLASELGLDDLIEYFSSKENPTELVLQEFDKTGKTLKDLRDILMGIGRPDAASLVQEQLQTSSRDLPSPSNDSGVGSPDTSETDSTPSLGSDKMFFPNSPSQSGERNSPQCMHCEESVPSHELYNSCANTCTGASGASERSTTTGSTCNKKVFQNSSSQSEERNSPQDMSCGESVASHELYNSCSNTEASGRNTKHFLTRF